MTRTVKMFRRVFVGRTVAAADVSARHAKAQMHPIVTRPQAVFATLRARCDLSNFFAMWAG
jgi:hypothetical protein